MRGQVAIVGAADTEVGKVPNISATGLCIDAACKALQDAGLDKGAIDGLVTCNSMAEPHLYHAEAMAEHLGIFPSYCVSAGAGGGTTFAVLYQAALAIMHGVCNTVLISMADSLRSGLSREQAMVMQSSSGHPQFETPYGGYGARLLRPDRQRLPAQVRSDRGAVCCGGCHRPRPCGLASWGADASAADRGGGAGQPPDRRPLAAAGLLLGLRRRRRGGVLTSAARAADCRQPPVYLLGAGEGHGHEHISQAEDLTSSHARYAGQRAYAMAGLGPKDMDLVELYDCFTPVVLIELEDLGFCARGQAGAFVAEGRTRLGGELPMNTHGGLLSHCHPGNPGAMFALTEAVRQLRWQAGERQVARAETALVHAQGGILSSHCTVILSRDNV